MQILRESVHGQMGVQELCLFLDVCWSPSEAVAAWDRRFCWAKGTAFASVL